MRKLVALSAVSVLLAACGSQPPAPEQDPSAVRSANTGATSTTVTQPTTTGTKLDPLAATKDPNSPLSKRMVYFDYDSYIVKDEYKGMLAQHAKFLAANSGIKMMVQGHADERGSREYNLALGQKRAEAVKKALALLGAAESQIESVSLGEEKPECMDATEECWARNRKGQMLYGGVAGGEF